MRISILREFLLLAEELNFSSVSKSFFISQSALSKHIDALESEVGTKLFVRDKHSVRLTETGKIFQQDIKSVINRYDNALENLRTAKKGYEEVLKVGYLHGAARLFLPDASKAFELACPNTQLKLYAEEAEMLLPHLKSNKLDIVVGMKLPGGNYDNYNYMHLYRDCLGVAVNKEHRLAKRSSICVDDLRGERILISGRDTQPSIYSFYQRIFKEDWFWENAEELVHDINSGQPYLYSEENALVSFCHLKTYFDDVSFVTFSDINTEFSIAAMWKTTNESESIKRFASILKQAAMRKINLLEESLASHNDITSAIK